MKRKLGSRFCCDNCEGGLSVPAKVRVQVEAAEIKVLDAWLDRVIDAPDLKSVFN